MCPLLHWQSRYSACACVHDAFKVACNAVLSEMYGQVQPEDLCPNQIWQSGRCACMFREPYYYTERRAEYAWQCGKKPERALEKVKPMSSFLS